MARDTFISCFFIIGWIVVRSRGVAIALIGRRRLTPSRSVNTPLFLIWAVGLLVAWLLADVAHILRLDRARVGRVPDLAAIKAFLLAGTLRLGCRCWGRTGWLSVALLFGSTPLGRLGR